MEISCTRCHQSIEESACFCPHCGLPQLVYASEGAPESAAVEPWSEEVVRDAASVDWRTALRYALVMAVPAAMLCSEISPIKGINLLVMVIASTVSVMLYLRNQTPAWITIGAGARIGLVTGILAGWLAFAFDGSVLCIRRFLLHKGGEMDSFWLNQVDQLQQISANMGTAETAEAKAVLTGYIGWLHTAEGRACMWTGNFATAAFFIAFFALLGGALGARLMARPRRRQY
jgi:hypothetical protein